MRRFSPLVLVICIVGAILSPAKAQTRATPGLCERDHKVADDVFYLVCAGRAAEARVIVARAANHHLSLNELVAYAAAHMERGDFDEAMTATRQMLSIARAAGEQSGTWYGRTRRDFGRRYSSGHSDLWRFRAIPTWPFGHPPVATAPPPPAPTTGLMAIHESLIAHTYEKVQRVLPQWLDLVVNSAVAEWQKAEICHRTGRYLVHAGADLLAARLLRRASCSGSPSGPRFETVLARVFAEAGEPERALMVLAAEGGRFSEIQPDARSEILRQLISHDRIEIAEQLLRHGGQRSVFALDLAEAYARRGERGAALEALNLAATQENQIEESARSYRSYLMFADGLHHLGDLRAARATLLAAEGVVSLPPGWTALEPRRRIDHAVAFSALRFARVRLLLESFEEALAAMPEPFSRTHLLALAINHAGEEGDVARASRLIDLIGRAWVPVSDAPEITRQYLSDEARFQAALRLAARGDGQAALQMVRQVRDTKGRAHAVDEVTKLMAMARAKQNVWFFVEHSSAARLPLH